MKRTFRSYVQAPLATTDLTLASTATVLCPPLVQAMTAKGSSGDGNGSISGNNGGVAAETEAVAVAATVETVAATTKAAKLRRLRQNVRLVAVTAAEGNDDNGGSGGSDGGEHRQQSIKRSSQRNCNGGAVMAVAVAEMTKATAKAMVTASWGRS